jgi:hypothetical protein
MIDYQKTSIGEPAVIVVHVLEYTDFPPESFYYADLSECPDRRPIWNAPVSHQGMVTELHRPSSRLCLDTPVNGQNLADP